MQTPARLLTMSKENRDMANRPNTCQFCVFRIRKRDNGKITHHRAMKPAEDFKDLEQTTIGPSYDKFRRR